MVAHYLFVQGLKNRRPALRIGFCLLGRACAKRSPSNSPAMAVVPPPIVVTTTSVPSIMVATPPVPPVMMAAAAPVSSSVHVAVTVAALDLDYGIIGRAKHARCCNGNRRSGLK